jgi:hypothetical protein
MPIVIVEGRLEPPPPLEVMWNSSVESSIMDCPGDGDPTMG